MFSPLWFVFSMYVCMKSLFAIFPTFPSTVYIFFYLSKFCKFTFIQSLWLHISFLSPYLPALWSSDFCTLSSWKICLNIFMLLWTTFWEYSSTIANFLFFFFHFGTIFAQEFFLVLVNTVPIAFWGHHFEMFPVWKVWYLLNSLWNEKILIEKCVVCH